MKIHSGECTTVLASVWIKCNKRDKKNNDNNNRREKALTNSNCQCNINTDNAQLKTTLSPNSISQHFILFHDFFFLFLSLQIEFCWLCAMYYVFISNDQINWAHWAWAWAWVKSVGFHIKHFILYQHILDSEISKKNVSSSIYVRKKKNKK